MFLDEKLFGGESMFRTHDLGIIRQILYQLSYLPRWEATIQSIKFVGIKQRSMTYVRHDAMLFLNSSKNRMITFILS